MIRQPHDLSGFHGTGLAGTVGSWLTHLLLAAVLCAVFPGAAAAQWSTNDHSQSFKVERPRKLLNVKIAPGLYSVYKGDSDVVSDTNRFVLQLGLQYAQYPWMVEFNYYTNVGIELFAGAYWPAFRLGPGWVAFTGGLFYKSSQETLLEVTCDDCEPVRYDEFLSTFGVGLAVDYLLLDGYLGFYLEAKQSIYFDPVGVTVVAGVNVSPLILLLLRNL